MNPSHIYKCKTLEKELSKYKLWGNLNPEKTYNINLEKILSKDEWNILREAMLKKCNYKCSICGALTIYPEIHEEWVYDYESSQQQLNKLTALCDLCYLNKCSEEDLDRRESILHWSLVNSVDCNNFEKYEKLVRELKDLRNNFNWKVVDHLGNDITKGIKLYDLLKLIAKDYNGKYVPNELDRKIPDILNYEDLTPKTDPKNLKNSELEVLQLEIEKECVSKGYKIINKNIQKETYYLEITKDNNEYFEIEIKKSVIEFSERIEKKLEYSPKFVEFKHFLLEFLKNRGFEFWSCYLTITGYTDDPEYVCLVGDDFIESIIPMTKVNSSFEDLLIWNLYFQKNNINYVLKISEGTKQIKLMSSSPSLEDIFDDIEKLSDLKKIRIYKWIKVCWKCHKPTPRVSYCLSFQGVVLGCIGYIEKLDNLLLKEYPFVKKTYSYTQGEEIIGNICVFCSAYQGNFFIFDEMLHYVDDHDLDKTIPNILNEEDLSPIISELAEFEVEDDSDNNNLNDIEFLYDFGLEYMRKCSYDYAISIFNKILQLESTESDALIYIGKIYIEKSEYDKAFETYNTALDINPNTSLISDVDLLLLEMEKELVSKSYIIHELGEEVLIIEKENTTYDIQMGIDLGYHEVKEVCNNIILPKDKEVIETLSYILAKYNYQINNFGTLFGEADYSIDLIKEEVIDDRLIVIFFEDFCVEINTYDKM